MKTDNAISYVLIILGVFLVISTFIPENNSLTVAEANQRIMNRTSIIGALTLIGLGVMLLRLR